jgi:hypothetical protein
MRTDHRVTGIVRDGARVETPEHAFRTRNVVLAMGRRGSPRRLGVRGEELGKVIYDVVDMESFAGQRMLVVGGGDSAVESAVGLARQEGTTVALSYRGDAFARVKERNRINLEQAIHCGKLRVMLRAGARDSADAVVLESGRRSAAERRWRSHGGDPPYKPRGDRRPLVKKTYRSKKRSLSCQGRNGERWSRCSSACCSAGFDAQVFPGPRAGRHLDGNLGWCHAKGEGAMDEALHVR